MDYSLLTRPSSVRRVARKASSFNSSSTLLVFLGLRSRLCHCSLSLLRSTGITLLRQSEHFRIYFLSGHVLLFLGSGIVASPLLSSFLYVCCNHSCQWSWDRCLLCHNANRRCARLPLSRWPSYRWMVRSDPRPIPILVANLNRVCL